MLHVLVRLFFAPWLVMAFARRWFARLLLLTIVAGFLMVLVDGFAHAREPDSSPRDAPAAEAGDARRVPPTPVPETRPGAACEALPGYGARLACGAVTGGVSGVAGQVFSSSLEGMVTAAADAAVWFFGKIAGLLDFTTRPDLRSPWFARQYSRMAALAWVTVLPLLLVAIIDAVVHARPGDVLMSLFVYLPIAGVVTFATLQIVDLLLMATDEASAFVSRDVGTDAATFLEGLGRVLTVTSDPTSPMFAVFIGALFGIVGALFLWVELILRNAGINLAVLFLPLAYATLVWPRVARWASRALRTLAALILSKFFIVVVISLGAAMLSSIGGGEAPIISGRASVSGGAVSQAGFDDVIAGSALLLLASAAPWVLWHLLAPVEGAMDSALEGSVRRPTAAVSPQRLSRVASVGGVASTGGAAAPVVAAASFGQAAYRGGSHATTDTFDAVDGQRPGVHGPESSTNGTPHGTPASESRAEAASGALPGSADTPEAPASSAVRRGTISEPGDPVRAARHAEPGTRDSTSRESDEGVPPRPAPSSPSTQPEEPGAAQVASARPGAPSREPPAPPRSDAQSPPASHPSPPPNNDPRSEERER